MRLYEPEFGEATYEREAMSEQELAQKIRTMAQEALYNMEVYKVDVLLIGSVYNPETVLEAIVKLCQEQLQEK